MKAGLIDKIPTPVLALGANALGLKYRLNRYSSSMRSIMAQWRSLENAPLEIQRDRQIKALRILLQKAEKTPFYRERFKDAGFNPKDFSCLEDLQAIPILTRTDIRDNFGRMLVPDITDQVITRKSSGTTGEPITFKQPRKLVFDYAYAALYQAYAWHGVSPLDKRASLAGRYMGSRSKGLVLRNHFENQLLLGVHSLRQDNVRKYITALRRFKPQILQAHPSAMLLLRKYALEEGLDPVDVPVVAFTGETLLAEERQLFEEWFSADVFGQYGSGEHHIASAQCKDQDGYHINPEFSYTEVVQTELGGQIVSTSLLNDVMPLIRYQIGDMADRIEENTCSCGCTWPRLMGLRGRADDVLVTSGGSMVPPVVLRTGLAAHFANLPPYTIVQHNEHGHYTIQVFTDRNSNDFTQVAAYMEEILGPGAQVKISVVSAEEQFTKRGKRKMVVRE